jgi:NADPH:quinone reductase-like Zn-dependent oxidoreductase
MRIAWWCLLPLSCAPRGMYRIRMAMSDSSTPKATMRTIPSCTSIPPVMKCILYGREQLELCSSRPTPKLGRRGHVVVRVAVAGLNPVDAKEIVGDKIPASWTTLRRWIKRYILANQAPGFDFAGICMEETGDLAVGDAVFGIMPPFGGTLAEYISVPVHQLCRMPTNLTFPEAAALPLVGYVFVILP